MNLRSPLSFFIVLFLFASSLAPEPARGDDTAPATPQVDPLTLMTSLANQRAQTLSSEDQALLQGILGDLPGKVEELTSVLGTASHGFAGPECLGLESLSAATAELKPLVTTAVLVFNGTKDVTLDPMIMEGMKHLAAAVAVDLVQTSYWVVSSSLPDGFLTPEAPRAPVFLSKTTLLIQADGVRKCLTHQDLATLMVRGALIHLRGSLPGAWTTPATEALIAAGYVTAISGY